MKSIDMKHDDLNILVDGRLVLHVGQVSDEKTINLFLYPKGWIGESIIHQENPDNKCTHEILVRRSGS